MSRADELRARFEAELAVVELEEALAAAKDTGEVSRDLKGQLRQAREAYRSLRAGDTVADPDVIQATGTVSEI